MIKQLWTKFFPRRTSEEGRPITEREPQSRVIREGDYSPTITNPFLLYRVFKRVPPAFATIRTIVNSMSAVPLRIRRRGQRNYIEPVEVHPIGKVLKYPNPYMTGYHLLERLYLDLEICGNAYWELVFDGDDLIAIFPLLPWQMKIVPHPRRFISQYVYKVGTREIVFQPREVIHFKYTDPTSEYYGMSFLEVSQTSAESDNFISRLIRKFFENDATPSIVIKYKNILSESAFQRLRKRWLSRHQGLERKFDVAILDDDMSIERLSLPLAELETSNLKSLLRDEIFVTGGVPPAIQGIAGVSNYAAARVAQSMFFDSQIAPRLRSITSTLDKELFARFCPTIEPVFDVSVSPINIAKMSANSRVVARLYTLGLLTFNESRMLLGLPPVPGGDDVFYRGNPLKDSDDDDTEDGEDG